MADQLELALLGNPELHLAGQPLGRFRSAKAYALLYYLAVTRRAQPRTVLAGLFWGDVDEYYARRNFNRTLSDVTQFVGDHLVVERQSVAFNHSQPYWLDVALLETASTTAPTAQNVATLAAAANLYRADFLDGFYVQEAPEFEQWVLRERGRLRAGALQLHDTLSHYYAHQGELMPAMDHARRMLQLEPWREEAHRQLMLLLAQSGQRSAALAQFELCRQALSSELDVEPDGATLDLVARIRADAIDKVTRRPDDKVTGRQDDQMTGEPTHPVTQSPSHPVAESPSHPVTLSAGHPAIPHNLPPQRTPFVGRAAEVADITRLLMEDEDCRLLTIVGPGGMGKTRLAIKAAEQIVAAPAHETRFGDGVFFVPLENVGDVDGLAAAIISAIREEGGLRAQRDAPLQEQLVHFLGPKAMLLVLDNFEHLVQHSELCSTLLATAPKVKLLITTRETVSLQEAWSYGLLGLAVPSSQGEQPGQQGEYDAVRLFAQCARRTRPDFSLKVERAAVLRICTLVEGMPLGIELAAAWLKVMTCEQIAQEIARGLDFLIARYHNIPARHRSMRAVMEHTWTLLAADEREAIARLTIFRGQFSQEAAAAITGAALLMLATLVDKALVRVTPDGYYQLHELTRQYAAEQLSDPTRKTLRDAHAAYYADLLARQQPRLFTSAYRQVWATVGGELDNIRHAWHWTVEAAGAERAELPLPDLLRQMAEVLTCYFLFHSLWLPGQAIFDHAYQVTEAVGWQQQNEVNSGQPSRHAALLKLQLSIAQFQLELGHFRESLALAERLLPVCRIFGWDDDLFRALMVYGHTQVRRGARHAALPAFEEALTFAAQLRLPRYRAEALIGLGLVASGEGRYADAERYYRQCLVLAQEIGYRPWIARILTNLGTVYYRQKEYQQSQSYYEQALAIAREEGDQSIVMISISNLGGAQRIFQHYTVSLHLYQESLAMARNLGEERWIAANLNGMAITYLEMKDLTAAERTLREALGVGHQSDSAPDTLGSIGLMGHCFAHRGHMAMAIKALLFVEQQPATLARDLAYNQPLLAELRSELPPALFEEATTWAADQTVADVLQWLLQDEPSFLPVK